MKKQALSACLAGTILLGSVTAPAMALSVDNFSDVEKSDWFYSSVQYVAEKEYMIGVSDHRFAPEMELSRAMFVTVLYRMEGVKEESQKSQFTDVPDGTWYTQAVNWAAANGIVQGNGANQFLPDELITRQDMCTMMARYISYHEKKHNVTHKKEGAEKTFTDQSQISSYAVDAVKNCVAWGLIEGNQLGQFMPMKTSSRAEAAAVISRLTWNDIGGIIGGVIGGIGGGGGGGGTPTPTPETADYTIKATLDLPDSLSVTDPDFAVAYNQVTINSGAVTGDKTFGQVAKDLVSGENATALKNAVTEALNKVKGKTAAQTVSGQQVTVRISDAGVISASVSVKVTDITGDKTRVSQKDLEDLINKLQKGGEMSFTQADLTVMEELLNKIEQVQGMTPQEIQDKIDQVAAEKPELEQMVSGMTPEAILEAAGSYQEELTQIKNEVQQAVDSGVTGPILVEKEPVLMNVAMDLGAYYEQAVDKFNTGKTDAIDRLEDKLGLTFTADQKAKAGAVYDRNNPANYVTNNGDGTLTLKSADAYFTLLQDNVDAGVSFYESLGQDAAFYQDLLERAENKYQDGYGVTYTGSVEDMAALLGDKDGILVDENKDFRDDMTFSITVEVNEDSYSSWSSLLFGNFTQADALPDGMPDALKGLLGTYTLTFSIDKK